MKTLDQAQAEWQEAHSETQRISTILDGHRATYESAQKSLDGAKELVDFYQPKFDAAKAISDAKLAERDALCPVENSEENA